MKSKFNAGDEVGVRTDLGLVVRARVVGNRDDGKVAVQQFNGCCWTDEEVVSSDKLTRFLPMPADRDLYESQVPTSERESTTFTQDFRIAEAFSVAAIQDTYNRAFSGWKHCYKYLTELTMTLNHRLFYWYNSAGENDPHTKLYTRLWQEAYDWGKSNLKGAELNYFLSVLD